MKKLATFTLLLLFALSSTACYSMTIRSGAPKGSYAVDMENKWHSGLIVGIVEVSGPYDLDLVCHGGNWAEIHTQLDLLTGVVHHFLGLVYSPQRVSVVCAGGKAQAVSTEAPAADAPSSDPAAFQP